MDADASERGLLAIVDARALTSRVALALALALAMSVCAIAIVGHIKHGNAGPAQATSEEEAAAVLPLVDEGVEIPTPAINLAQIQEEGQASRAVSSEP